jgi:ribonuclease P protein component
VLPRRLRLRRAQDFERVHRHGKTWSNRLVAIGVLPNDFDHNRFGFIVVRQLGSAVIRNRIKRRLRAVVRQQLDDLRPGYDVVIIARKPAAQADFQALSGAVSKLLERARLIREE